MCSDCASPCSISVPRASHLRHLPIALETIHSFSYTDWFSSYKYTLGSNAIPLKSMAASFRLIHIQSLSSIVEFLAQFITNFVTAMLIAKLSSHSGNEILIFEYGNNVNFSSMDDAV